MASVIEQLIKRDKSKCHYCRVQVRRPKKGATPKSIDATRDHVVPRAFGGPNAIDNYVLACSMCNNNRGTQLFYCGCSPCRSRIEEALRCPDFINGLFKGIVSHNKPRVYRTEYGEWVARLGHSRRKFDSWEEAQDYALNGAFTKGK